MAMVQGRWQLIWNGNLIDGIEEIEVNYERSSDDYETVQYQTRTVYGSTKADVGLTVLESDVATLGALVPQYLVAQGGTLSTGENVTDVDGAIDVIDNCNDAPVYGDLDIISCGDPGQVFRLVNAYTQVDSVEFDGKVRKVVVRFIGEAPANAATIQFFKENGINPVS